MKIHFVHLGDAYLPELQAYAAFVQLAGHQAQLHRQLSTLPNDAAVLWWMCGQVSAATAQHFPKAFHIHEYASASVPPMAGLKDCIKRFHQPTPHFRIFQNDWVRGRMGFNDGVPFEFRDMGIATCATCEQVAIVDPEFDFVYLGEMRRLLHFLPVFSALFQLGRRILLVGEIPDSLKQILLRHTNVHMIGRVPHTEVPTLLRTARYGLNLVPNQLPFTRQTSTKLLEYCAANLRVVTTDYVWVRDFEKMHFARFAYIPKKASMTTYLEIFGHELDKRILQVPDVRVLEWSRVLANLGIWKRLDFHMQHLAKGL